MEKTKMKKEDGVKLSKRSADGKIAYLIKPILTVLQDAGGQLERSEIKERIADLDDQIAEFAEEVKKSKKTGNSYKEFNFKFNFAIKDLLFNELVTFSHSSPVTLTEKGENLDLDKLDVSEIIKTAAKHWEKLSKRRQKKTDFDIDDNEEESSPEEALIEAFNEALLDSISKMSSKKFEAFSRALLNKMGVEFTEKGVQVSNDGGIDGYGYHIDADDFRTTRVVIQCKKWNSNPVGEPEINQFLGAMNKNKADYGVFITNGRFTNAARKAAKEGTPITLINGNELVRLVKKFKLFVKPVETFVLGEFYDSNE